MLKRFHYLTCCVNSTAQLIDEMVDQAHDVTYETIRKHCDLAEFKDGMGYVDNPQHGGLSLKRDYAVSFHKSVYDGQPCYYICHSAIEYIFTEN